jgi:hypothetical protein
VAAASPPGRQAALAVICAVLLGFELGMALAIFLGGHSKLGGCIKEENIMDQSRLKVCYVITQRGEKKYWNRVGVAFLNSDGSINVKLESLPVAGDFQIRDYVPRDENAGTTLRGRNGQSDDEAFAA